jgi:hypothetical protein
MNLELVSNERMKSAVARTRALLQDVVGTVSERIARANVRGWSGLQVFAPRAAQADSLEARVAAMSDEELDALSRVELYELATRLNVRGRKNMRKAQLVASIREVTALDFIAEA